MPYFFVSIFFYSNFIEIKIIKGMNHMVQIYDFSASHFLREINLASLWPKNWHWILILTNLSPEKLPKIVKIKIMSI